MDEDAISKNLFNMQYRFHDVANATLFGHILQGLISMQGKHDPRGDVEIQNTVDLAWKYFERSWNTLQDRVQGMAIRKVQSDIDSRTKT